MQIAHAALSAVLDANGAEQLLGLWLGQPIPCPDAEMLDPAHAADAGSDFRGQQRIVGGLHCQFADGCQADIDGGCRQAVALQSGAVLLHHRFAEGTGGSGPIPGQKIVERFGIGATGMGRSDGIEHQGLEPRQVSCQAWNPPWSKFAEPAAAAATIAFDGGTMVSYRGSWVSPAPQTHWAGECHMECERGEISWTSRDNTGVGGDRVTVRLLGKPARRVALPELPAIDRAGSLAAFAQAIDSGQEPECSGRANLGSLSLALATIESATVGLSVPVPAI